MKRFLLLGLLFVIVFTLGMLSQFFFKSHSTVYTGLSFDKEIQKIINNNNELLYSNTKIRVSLLEHYISDTTISEYILMKKTDSIVDYFGYILSSDENLNDFSLVKIKTILKDYVYLDDFYSDVELIDIRYNTIEEKKLYIDLCYNIIINRCLAEYQESSIMVGAFEGVSIIAPNDTIRAGDFFEAKIYFSVRDLTLNYNIELEDSVFFSGDIYKEKAIKKGLNTRKGRLIYLNGRKELIFPFEFSYYVK